jgi:serine/threonine protein kinase
VPGSAWRSTSWPHGSPTYHFPHVALSLPQLLGLRHRRHTDTTTLYQLGKTCASLFYLLGRCCLVLPQVPKRKKSKLAVTEAYNMALIDHINIVSHHETFIHDGQLVLVMEYCEVSSRLYYLPL